MESRLLFSLCLALAGCAHRPLGAVLPEPSVDEAVEGMIVQTFYVLSSPSGDKVAMRRCTYVDRLPDRCEITFVVDGRIVERVPTYVPGWGDLVEQGLRTVKPVAKAVERHLGKDRVALTRLGIFGAKDPPEGHVTVVLSGHRVELVTRDDHRVLAATEAPPGVVGVQEHYRSERAPDLFVVSLTAESATNPSRPSGFVVFHRSGPLDFHATAVVPPIDPRPVAPPAPPSYEPSNQPVIVAPPAPSERVLQVPR